MFARLMKNTPMQFGKTRIKDCMMGYEIVKTESGKYALYIDGCHIHDYSRRRDAVRRVRQLQEQGVADAQTDSREAAAVCAGAQPAPASNTGGTDCAGQVSQSYSHTVMVRGKVKRIPLRRGVGTAAHIDTLTLTMREDVFAQEVKTHTDETKAELAKIISQTIHTLMGFGIYEERNGINGYKHSYRMGTDNATYGVVAFGGTNQKGSVMIYFYGDGLTAAKDGWETRLYNWLGAFAPYATITRCDLAHDFLDGGYTPDQAYQDWLGGGYTANNRRPRARKHGYDWLDDQRTGKTFYVGTPQSSRLLRVYEKGCEQGDYTSPWVRVELQLRNREIIIPHEILLYPGEYLTGAYPALAALFAEYTHTPKKVEYTKKFIEIGLEHCVRYASMQASGTVNALEAYGLADHEIVKLLKGGKKNCPSG
nr:replication initiation factor domain-containing protein [Conchiformibius kuhniae]